MTTTPSTAQTVLTDLPGLTSLFSVIAAFIQPVETAIANAFPTVGNDLTAAKAKVTAILGTIVPEAEQVVNAVVAGAPALIQGLQAAGQLSAGAAAADTTVVAAVNAVASAVTAVTGASAPTTTTMPTTPQS